MIDGYVPTTDGRALSLTRYTQPESELKLLLDKLKLALPAATAENQRLRGRHRSGRVVQTF